jgi:hypothetical protein
MWVSCDIKKNKDGYFCEFIISIKITNKKLQISSFKKHFSTLGGEKNSFTKSLNA